MLVSAVAVLAVLALAPAIQAVVAPGSKCVGGPGCAVLPPPTGVYSGSDKAGPVRFTLSRQTRTGPRGPRALVIRDLSFANRCAPGGTRVAGTRVGGTRVTRAIAVGRRYRFTLHKAGIAVSGSFVRVFLGNLFQRGEAGVARGTARIRTARCDSGALSFQVESR